MRLKWIAVSAFALVAILGFALVGGFRSSPWLDDTWYFWLPKGRALDVLGLTPRLWHPNLALHMTFGHDYESLWFIRPGYLSPELWPESKSILFGAGVLFIGYEGFGLITNAAADMRNPSTMLPRALYTSVILVIILYLAVALTVSGSLSDYEIERARDYALAEAAKPSLGEFGFRLLAIAAVFSTASAINATLFGSANVCYMIARDGELPAGLSRTEWKDATGGLILTAALVLVVTLLFDLSGIAMMGSAAFLLIYAAVNAGHLNVLRQTGASVLIVWASLITCLVMFVVLAVYTYQEQPAAIAALVIIAVASFAAEWSYRHWTGRTLKDHA